MDPFSIDQAADVVEAYLYKKVANKTRPVATTLPENSQIITHDHPNSLAGMPPLPPRPPDFVPTSHFTPERRNQMPLGCKSMWPEGIKLAESAFGPKYFVPIEIPRTLHIPWVLQQGPIPRGILDEVTKIIKWPKHLPSKATLTMSEQRLHCPYDPLSSCPTTFGHFSFFTHLPTTMDIPRLWITL
jgi:hypothetical protein